MSKKNRNRNSFVSKENRAIEMINKNRHYTDDVRQGLINLVKRDSSLQDNVRKAYQKVTDWLRDPNRGCLEFQVERINIRSWDKDADREEWLKELCKFVDEQNSAVFTEYGVKRVYLYRSLFCLLKINLNMSSILRNCLLTSIRVIPIV